MPETNDVQQHRDSFTIRLGKPDQMVSVETLTESLVAIRSVITEISREITGETDFTLSARAFRPGSFEIPCELVLIAGQCLPYLPQSLQTAKTAVDVLAGLIEMRLRTGSRDAPQSEITGSDSVVTAGDGSPVDIHPIVVNVNLNDNASMSLGALFGSLDRDSSVREFSISRENENLARVTRSEFPAFSRSSTAGSGDQNTLSVRASLYISKCVFDGKATKKWSFIYGGNTISANIRDANFLRRVVSGQERFGSGDVLEVIMHIKQRFDQTVNTLRNESYEVTEVLTHVPRGNQQEMTMPA